MDIEPLDASFGAILRDIALADLNEDAFRTLYDIWLDYGLLVFPGQHLNNASQIDFTRRFGELDFEILCCQMSRMTVRSARIVKTIWSRS